MTRCPDHLCPGCDMHVKDCQCKGLTFGDLTVARIVDARADRARGDWESDAAILYESRD